MEPARVNSLPSEVLARQELADALVLRPEALPWRSDFSERNMTQAIEVFDGESAKFTYQVSLLQGAMPDPTLLLVKLQTVNKAELAGASGPLARDAATRSFNVFALQITQGEPTEAVNPILRTIRDIAQKDSSFEANIPGLSIESSERNDQLQRLLCRPLTSSGSLVTRNLPSELGYAEWFHEVAKYQWK